VYSDSCTGNWRDNWLNDAGGTLRNSADGMRFVNPERHDVVWFKHAIEGDVRIKCEICNNGDSKNAHILFIQATGIGGDYPENILEWQSKRSAANYDLYRYKMNNVGLSMDNPQNQIRFRHNAGFLLLKTYAEANLFGKGMHYHIAAQKVGKTVSFEVSHQESGEHKTYAATLENKPLINTGHIGFRQMIGRDVTYKNFKVYTRDKPAESAYNSMQRQVALKSAFSQQRNKCICLKMSTGLLHYATSAKGKREAAILLTTPNGRMLSE
jgi:hypothetical protein